MRSANLYNRVEYPKIEIRNLFILRTSSGHKKTTNIAILTTNGKYIEYEFQLKQKNITSFIALRIRSLFNPYKLTRRSEVMINDQYDTNEPLYLYIQFLKQHIQFNFRRVSVDQIVRGVCNCNLWRLTKDKKNKNINKYFLKKLWQKIIHLKKCYWITQEYDYKLQNTDINTAREKKILRVGIYYMIVRRRKAEINERCKDKKKQKLESF